MIAVSQPEDDEVRTLRPSEARHEAKSARASSGSPKPLAAEGKEAAAADRRAKRLEEDHNIFRSSRKDEEEEQFQ